MSQEDIFNVVKKLGGKATLEEIRDYVKKEYPTRTLHMYIPIRLRQLEKNDFIVYTNKKWVLKRKNYHNK
jgi:hypothetical protein